MEGGKTGEETVGRVGGVTYRDIGGKDGALHRATAGGSRVCERERGMTGFYWKGRIEEGADSGRWPQGGYSGGDKRASQPISSLALRKICESQERGTFRRISETGQKK